MKPLFQIYQRKWRQKSNEQGSVLIIVAVSIVALFGFAGLVIDFGQAYSKKPPCKALRMRLRSRALSVAVSMISMLTVSIRH